MRPISQEALGLETGAVKDEHAQLDASFGWTSLTSYVRVSDLDTGQEGFQLGDFQPTGRSTGLFYQDFKQRVLADDVSIPCFDALEGDWVVSKPVETLETTVFTALPRDVDVGRRHSTVSKERRHRGTTHVSLDEMTNTNGDIIDTRIRFTSKDAPVSPVRYVRSKPTCISRPANYTNRDHGNQRKQVRRSERYYNSDSRLVAPIERRPDQLRGFNSTGDIQGNYGDETPVPMAVRHKPKLAQRKDLSHCVYRTSSCKPAAVEDQYSLQLPDRVNSPVSIERTMCKRKRCRLLEQQVHAVTEQPKEYRDTRCCKNNYKLSHSGLPVTETRVSPTNNLNDCPTISGECKYVSEDCLLRIHPVLPPTRTKVARLVKCKVKATRHAANVGIHNPTSAAELDARKTTNAVPSPVPAQKKRRPVPETGGLSEYLCGSEPRNTFQSPLQVATHIDAAAPERVSTQKRRLKSRRLTTLGPSNLKNVQCRRQMSFCETGAESDAARTPLTTNTGITTCSGRLTPVDSKVRRLCLGVTAKCRRTSDITVDTLDVGTVCDIKTRLTKENRKKPRIITNGSFASQTCRGSPGIASPRRKGVWSPRIVGTRTGKTSELSSCRVSIETCV